MAESDESPKGTPPPEGPPEGASPSSDPPQGEPEDLADQLRHWRAEARKHEERARKGAAAEKRLQELEDAQKTELERAQETARAASERAQAAELRALRAEVAARKGLNTAQAKRLQGSTEEELEADADELLAAFTSSAESPPTNGDRADRAPIPKLRPGAVSDAGPVERDPAKLAAQIPRRGF